MVMFFGVSYVYAQEQGDPPRHGWMHGEKSWGQGKRINLTPEQKAKFQELDRKFRGVNAQLIGAIVAKRLELQNVWTDPKADSKPILDKEKEMTALQDQMRDKVVQMKLEARKLLTPEQIANWKPGWGMGRGRMIVGPGHMMGPGQGRGRGWGKRY